MLELLLVELLLVELLELRVLQEFQVCCFVSWGGVLDEEVGPLVEVETGLNRQASSGRWKSCLSSFRAAK